MGLVLDKQMQVANEIADIALILDYNPDSGDFTYMQTRGTAKAGDFAGSLDMEGYREIRVFGRTWKAHRLAWFITNGVIPPGPIDHINGRPADNRITNLRCVTQTENAQSKFRARADSKTGLRGVSVRGNRFSAAIVYGGKTRKLGMFDTAEQAHAAYLRAKSIFHPVSEVAKPFFP